MQTAPPYAQSEGEPPSALLPASRAGYHSQSPVTCPAVSTTCEQYWGGASKPGELRSLGCLDSLSQHQLTPARALEGRQLWLKAPGMNPVDSTTWWLSFHTVPPDYSPGARGGGQGVG